MAQVHSGINAGCYILHPTCSPHPQSAQPNSPHILFRLRALGPWPCQWPAAWKKNKPKTPLCSAHSIPDPASPALSRHTFLDVESSSGAGLLFSPSWCTAHGLGTELWTWYSSLSAGSFHKFLSALSAHWDQRWAKLTFQEREHFP